jgi:Tfp pilus assembly protein PilF
MTRRGGAWAAAAFVVGAALLPSAASQPAAPARQRLEQAYRLSNRGVGYLEQYDYAAAAAAFRDSLAVDPSLAHAHLGLAIALLYAGQPEGALPEARAAAAALPAAPQPVFILGLIARAVNDADLAERSFRRVLEMDPSDAASHVNLGQLLTQRRQFSEAGAAFRAALAAEPYNATAAYGLATALTRAGDATAAEAMRRFQTLRDSPSSVTYSQGYLQQGRYGEALTSTGAEPGVVDLAPPAVRFRNADVAAGGAGTVLLFDADRSGSLDLLIVDPKGVRLARHGPGGFAAPVSLPQAAVPAGQHAAVAGDYDNDGRADLFVFGPGGARLLHQRADGSFEDTTEAAGFPRDVRASAAAWVDVDHDGDLDLVTAAPVRLFRNNGNGTFTDITRDAGLSVPDGDLAAPAAVVPTDFDNRRDVDLLILSGGAAPRLYRNMRDGTFDDVAAAAGLPRQGGITCVAAADVNKDGFIDFFFGRQDGPGIFALSDGQSRFALRDAPGGTVASSLAQFFDYDNDGLLDLIVANADGLRLFRNVGAAWSDETIRTGLNAARGPIRSFALGHLNRAGAPDIITASDAAVTRWHSEDSGHQIVAVALAPRSSNRSGFGAKVEIRAGSLRQMLETSSGFPPVGPPDLAFGLGDRRAADVIRVLWPSGILQTELDPVSPVTVQELDRKPSSCPYLFTWNGSRFEFITDFLGGGEIGDWEAPGSFDTPDPDEYVRIPADRLVPRDGRYEIRITNELEEALFLDRVRLFAVDHPADVDVYPNEGLKDPPRPPFHLYATRGAHVPVSAVDDHGHDVRALIAERDRRWPDDFALERIGGYAAPHTLTLDLGKNADRAVLLLTGWTAYAFSTDNVAASQAGLALHPPSLAVRDASGAWQTIDDNVGFPVGRPQTIAVDLTGRWRGPSREVRLSTNMPIYWDQILVDTSGGSAQYRMTAIDPATAVLRWRGFSAEQSADGREPFAAIYDQVSTVMPWKAFPGFYTREGDVRGLLSKSDDMFVIAKAGDEIALSFPVSAAPPIRAGWRRTFLLYGDGYSKEMNIRSATPDSLLPLPFHAMSRYPYGPEEHYPRDRAHTAYLARQNARYVARVVPSVDAAAAPPRPAQGDRR